MAYSTAGLLEMDCSIRIPEPDTGQNHYGLTIGQGAKPGHLEIKPEKEKKI